MYLTAWDKSDGMLGAAAGDEIIGGARLQWSPSAGLDSAYWGLSLQSTEFAKRVGQLRNAMESDPDRFLSVQMGTPKYDNAAALAFKTYPGVIVAEFTSPRNRRLRFDVRWDLEQLAKSAGIAVDPNPAHNNLRIVRQGGPGGAPADPGKPTIPPPGDDPDKNDFLANLAKGLGVSTPIVVGGLLLVAVIALKR